ncbi:MAG: carbonic anhydrase family protein [Byssovorax sp.]
MVPRTLGLGLALVVALTGCTPDTLAPVGTGTVGATSTATASSSSGGVGGAGTSSSGVGTSGSGGASSSSGAGGATCGTAVDKPHDPTKAEWSYHDPSDGPTKWGTLMGDATCGAGQAQTPIDLVDATAVGSAKPLVFSNYGKTVPVDLLDNGHTLQVNYATTMSAEDPQITYDGKTYYLLQFHWHSTSEHTMAGQASLFEAHFVHKAADGALAVVGVLFDDGADNASLARLMHDDPGHEKESICSDGVKLDDLLPASRGFYHYSGSLTTPPCTEGLNWFVMMSPLQASAKQQAAYQTGFVGTTNRPIQPLDGRTVDKHAP